MNRQYLQDRVMRLANLQLSLGPKECLRWSTEGCFLPLLVEGHLKESAVQYYLLSVTTVFTVLLCYTVPTSHPSIRPLARAGSNHQSSIIHHHSDHDLIDCITSHQ